MLSATIVAASTRCVCEPQTAASMNKPENSKLYIDLSVEVLKNQDRKAIEFLKNFLRVLPSLTEISAVLMAALEKLAQTDPDSCRWILRHPQYLMPELDLLTWGQQILTCKLQTGEIIPDRDFWVDKNARILLTKEAKLRLIVSSIEIEFLILEETISTYRNRDISDF